MKVNRVVIRVSQRLLNLIYPRRCPVCHEIVAQKDRLVCDRCRIKLKYAREPRCKKCGKPISAEEKEYCMDCSRRAHEYEYGYGLFEYNEILKKSIGKFKYQNRREYKDFYIEEMQREYKEIVKKWNPDGIIPVPLHISKHRKRGFNQAELIARGLGRAFDIPVYSNIVVRVKKTRPQKELNNRERAANLKTAFKITEDDVKLKTVILVDDIYTTGSTIDAVARVLRGKGVQKVYFLCIGIGRGY